MPEVVACSDAELHAMLSQSAPPSRHTDDVGRPWPGSGWIAEHPNLPNYRRVMRIRHQVCVEACDDIGALYCGRIIGFIDAHAPLRLLIVVLSTERDCYEFLYSAGEQAALFSAVRFLEGRSIESI